MPEEVDHYYASPKKICGPEATNCTKVCSCSECLVQKKKLKDFDKNVRLNTTKVDECFYELSDAKRRVVDISQSICCASDLLDFLHTRLEAVDKKLGVLPSLEKNPKIGETDRKTWDAILDCELLFPDYKERFAEQSLEENDDDVDLRRDKRSVIDRVNVGLVIFGKTSEKERARDILVNITKVESTELANLSPQTLKKKKLAHLSPQTLEKKKLELQIQLVNMLPIDRLVCEFNEEIERASKIELNLPKLEKARKIIGKVDLVYLRTFLQKYQSLAGSCPLTGACMHKGKGKEHGPTRLKGVLEFLVGKVELFEKQWDDEYAPLITNCGRTHKTSSTQGSQSDDLTTLFSEFLQQLK